MSAQVVEADWTWTGGGFEPGMQVQISAEGRIEAVGRLGREAARRLRHRALLPGMINAHSHAFQRGLRGRGERFPDGTSSFWTWRQAMYQLVGTLEPTSFYRLCLQTFREMLEGGITAVGEFHYLHHNKGNADYAFDQLVLDAASEVGIRLALLNAYYNTGGIGQPLAAAQRRFASVDPQAYWEQMDRLSSRLDPRTQSLGAVAHSIRAASPEDIASLQGEATRRGLVFHIHLEEQRKEVEECIAAYGKRPMALLNDTAAISDGITAVHCTHTDPQDMERFLAGGGMVCVCPLTEANLGDGIPNLQRVHTAGDRLSLGTDSNARICMTEEMRWLEYGQRLTSETRGVLTDASGSVAKTLFQAATVNGAKALGMEAGQIAPGMWADLFAIDLDAPALAGSDEHTLLDAFVFGAGNEVVNEVCVGGRWRERDG